MAEVKPIKIVGGDRGVVAGGGILKLALAAVDKAWALGLVRGPFQGSPNGSRYVYLRDRHAREWRLRISNHHKPRRALFCHFDLVSYDGVFGRNQLLAFVESIADGSAAWVDAKSASSSKPAPRLLARIKRRSAR